MTVDTQLAEETSKIRMRAGRCIMAATNNASIARYTNRKAQMLSEQSLGMLELLVVVVQELGKRLCSVEHRKYIYVEQNPQTTDIARRKCVVEIEAALITPVLSGILQTSR